MDQTNSASAVGGTIVEGTSDRELIVTRTFDAPARLLFKAWTTPALFMQWWAPKSIGVPMLSCEMDVRVGGGYCVAFGEDAATAMKFYGEYIEVVPDARLVWTNEEEADGAVTTVTFEEKDGKTLLTYRELFASKEALDGEGGGIMPEQLDQLDALLASLEAGA
ncbi:SRPBCC family protein [Sphingomonas crusticola]|uniref:SRPBCC family protein n=1 Tax=Sphingomonas crusticola TaxID=1697973 RepID=UPI000E266CDC|nr:SRPBCC family protein [Sphingomonas crusticola]